MRAVVYDRYGDERVLRMARPAAPEPGPGEVLVRVAATSMNPSDRALRAGELRRVLRLRLPFTPGSDVAGIIERTGPDVEGLAPGRAVWAMQPPKTGGACAELVVVSADHMSPAPQSLRLQDAAALPLVALTALQALRDKAGLRAGQRLLVHGAAGGVGTAAVQLGLRLGAHVTAIAGRRHDALLRELGAHRVLAREDVAGAALAPGRHDVVLDAVALLDGRALRRWLVPGGMAVSTDPSRGVKSVFGAPLNRGRRVRGTVVRPSATDLEHLARWADEGALRPVVERIRPLEEVAEAHRDSARRDAQGKTVLVVDAALGAITPDLHAVDRA